MAENRNSIIDENSGFSFYLEQDENGNDIAVIDSFTRQEDDLYIPETVGDGNGNQYDVKRLEIEAWYNSITIPDSVEINQEKMLLSQFNEVHLSERYKDFDAEELSDKLGILGNTMIYIGDTKIDYRSWSSYPNNFDVHSITDFGDRDSGFEGQLVIANNISQGDYLAITNCSHNGVVNSEEEKLSAYIPPADSGYVNSQTGKPFVNSDGELLHLDTVGTHAFYATPITDVVVPEGYKVVQYKAFDGCEYLTSASFPSTMEYYGQDLFEHCNNLEKITVNVSSKNKDNITPILPKNIGYGPSKDMIIEYKDENGIVLSSMTYGDLKTKYPSNDYEEPAPDFVSNGISYIIDEETKRVTVCAIDDNLGKEISIPKEIEIEGEKYTVFSIDQNAISSYSDVETLNLPYICYEDACWLLCNSNCQVNFYNESGQTVESATVQELYENRISWVKESEASGHYEGYDKAVIDEIKNKFIRSLVIPHKYDTCITNLNPKLYSDDVVGIGKNILDGCNNVQRVCISRDVELPDGVFANCNATEYVLPTNERNNIERLGIKPDATIIFADRYYENLNDPDTYKVLPVRLTYSEEHKPIKEVSLGAALDRSDLVAALDQSSNSAQVTIKKSTNGQGLG